MPLVRGYPAASKSGQLWERSLALWPGGRFPKEKRSSGTQIWLDFPPAEHGHLNVSRFCT